MQDRVRGIVVKEGAIALIKRVKGDVIYYIFPGGGVEEGETLEQALRREMKEELGIQISIGEKFAEHRHTVPENNSHHHFYICEETGGTFGTGDGPEYAENSVYLYEGTHEPVWVPLTELKNIDLKPVEVKEMVIKRFGEV